MIDAGWRALAVAALSAACALAAPAGAQSNVDTVLTTSQLGSDDLYFPPGSFFASSVMNTLRLPLSAFAGVNLNNVESIAFVYDGTPNGTVLLSDIAFVDDEEGTPPPAPGCQASQSFIVGSGGTVTTSDGSPAVHSSGTGLTRIDGSAQSIEVIQGCVCERTIKR